MIRAKPSSLAGARMQNSDPRQDRIYKAIQILFVIDVLLGLGLAAVGYWGLDQPNIAAAGIILAGIGLVLWIFFRILGGTADRRSRNR
jgi:hypothetical protein